MFVGIVAGASRSLVAPGTAYANSGGTGDRTASITVTTSGWNGTITKSNAVDGATGANTTDGINPTSVSNGATMTFDFGAGVQKYIDEVTVYWNNSSAGYLTHWQGSNNGTDWTPLSSDVGYTTNTMVFTLTPETTGYRYYRWYKTSGTVPAGYLLEVEFKIADGA